VEWVRNRAVPCQSVLPFTKYSCILYAGTELLLDQPVGGHWTTTTDIYTKSSGISNSNCFTSVIFNVITGLWGSKLGGTEKAVVHMGQKVGRP